MANKNIFIKDFTKFFTGAFVAQVLGFALSPVLSRIYLPEDFGIFTFYSQILAASIVLGGGSIFLLLPIIKDRSVNKPIFQIVMIFSLIISLIIMFLGVSGVGSSIYLNTLWPYLIFGVIVTNIRGFYHFLSIKEKKYSQNSKAKLSESIVGSGLNISLGLSGFNQFGLILGNLFGQIFFIFFIIKKMSNSFFEYFILEKLFVYKEIIFKYKKHITLQSLNHLLEFVLVLLFSFLITKVSSISELGYFAFCYKIINTPLNLVADYFGQAALSRISDFSSDLDRRKFLLKISLLITTPAFLCVLLFYFLGPEIFNIIFGEKWEQSGLIAKAYTLGICSTFFIRSLQYIPNTKNKHEVYTVFSLLTFGVPVLVMLYSSANNFDFLWSLKLISFGTFVLAILYFITLLRLFKTK